MITADQGVRGGKLIELKKTVVTAVAKCPSVTTILVSKRTGNTVVASPLDLDLDEVGTASLIFKYESYLNQELLFRQ